MRRVAGKPVGAEGKPVGAEGKPVRAGVRVTGAEEEDPVDAIP